MSHILLDTRLIMLDHSMAVGFLPETSCTASSDGEKCSLSLATMVASVVLGCDAGVDSDRRTGWIDLGAMSCLDSAESMLLNVFFPNAPGLNHDITCSLVKLACSSESSRWANAHPPHRVSARMSSLSCNQSVHGHSFEDASRAATTAPSVSYFVPFEDTLSGNREL